MQALAIDEQAVRLQKIGHRHRCTVEIEEQIVGVQRLIAGLWDEPGAFDERAGRGLHVAAQFFGRNVCGVHAPSIFQLQRSEVDLRAVK